MSTYEAGPTDHIVEYVTVHEQRQPRHHVLFDKATWDANRNRKLLRDNPGMIAIIDTDSHKEIHRELSQVPAPDHHMAGRIQRAMLLTSQLIDPYDTLAVIDTFIMSTNEAMKHPKANDLDRALGGLTIAAVEIQKKIIEQGLPRGKVIDLATFARRRAANERDAGVDEVS